MMNRSLLSALLASLFAVPALAFEPFAVKDIRIEGIQRTEAGTVFSYLPVKVGDTLTAEKSAQSIKALFATGFFKDVRIEAEGQVMVVIVQERPAIARIDFVGMKEFEKDAIIKALKETGIGEGRIFDRALLDKAEQELKRQYLSRGKYAANITTTVTPLERNRVGINFNIVEGDAAKIKQINIVGNSAFKEKTLLDLFELTTPGWMTWYTKNDQYSRQKLAADLEKLKSFYMNQGYLEFSVESTQVSISPDKQDIYITLNVSEGERYQVSSVKLAGDFSISEKELKKLVTIQPGDIFSREQLNNSTKAISDRLGKEGYAFANVNASPEIDKDKRQVAFTIFVDTGKRVYVRRVNITGNTRTRDEVVRREVRQMEGGWYDADRITNSKDRINRLGYFTDVTVETPAVPGTADQVDVNLNVTEKPTGNLMLGVGSSSTDKLILSGSISQDNFMGSGNNVGIQVNSAKSQQTYVLSYTNPYFTIDGVSQGFDIYRRTIDTSSLALAYYKSSSNGAGFRFGFPISEKESLGFGIGVDDTSISVDSTSPIRYQQFVGYPGTSSKRNLTFPLTLSWASDSKDSFFFPTKGTFQRAGIEIALPGGDLQYYRATYQLQHFFALSRRFTLMVNGELGYAGKYGNTDEMPFYKNFYAGGVGSVRGYKASSLGPMDNSSGTNEALGGTTRVIGNAELLWALPGMEKSFRMGLFFDAGQVYGKDQNGKNQSVDLGQLRYSTGLSASWVSPVGPLKFSLGMPINKKSGDQTEVFQFQLGTTF